MNQVMKRPKCVPSLQSEPVRDKIFVWGYTCTCMWTWANNVWCNFFFFFFFLGGYFHNQKLCLPCELSSSCLLEHCRSLWMGIRDFYCIRHIFRVQIFSRFWIRLGNSRGLNFVIFFFNMFSILLIAIILKGNFLRGLTRKIRENKTTAKITTYTVDCVDWTWTETCWS